MLSQHRGFSSGRWRLRNKPQLFLGIAVLLLSLIGRVIGILKDRTVNPTAQIPLDTSHLAIRPSFHGHHFWIKRDENSILILSNVLQVHRIEHGWYTYGPITTA